MKSKNKEDQDGEKTVLLAKGTNTNGYGAIEAMSVTVEINNGYPFFKKPVTEAQKEEEFLLKTQLLINWLTVLEKEYASFFDESGQQKITDANGNIIDNARIEGLLVGYEEIAKQIVDSEIDKAGIQRVNDGVAINRQIQKMIDALVELFTGYHVPQEMQIEAQKRYDDLAKFMLENSKKPYVFVGSITDRINKQLPHTLNNLQTRPS